MTETPQGNQIQRNDQPIHNSHGQLQLGEIANLRIYFQLSVDDGQGNRQSATRNNVTKGNREMLMRLFRRKSVATDAVLKAEQSVGLTELLTELSSYGYVNVYSNRHALGPKDKWICRLEADGPHGADIKLKAEGSDPLSATDDVLRQIKAVNQALSNRA